MIKKLSLISLVASACLLSNVQAEDTLKEAFQNGKVSGAVQASYWERDHGTDAEIMNFGLDLSYETASFYNFGLKSTFQSSSSPFIDDEARTVFNGDMYGSGTQLSELYLSYKLGKTTAQIGRMYFGTPLIAGSGSRMNREAFEGALVTNSDISDTKVTIGYVQKMQNRTDTDGNIGEFTKVFTWQGTVVNGAYTAVIENSSIKNVDLTVAYLDAKDLMDVVYVEAAFNEENFGLASQYYYSDYTGTNNTDLFGLKGNIAIGKATVVIAYTTTGDEYVYPGLGNGADYAYAGSVLLSDSYVKNTDSYKIGVSYVIMPDLNAGMSYVLENGTAAKYSYTSVTADYTLSGLNIALAYEETGKDIDKKELRLNVNYPF